MLIFCDFDRRPCRSCGRCWNSLESLVRSPHPPRNLCFRFVIMVIILLVRWYKEATALMMDGCCWVKSWNGCTTVIRAWSSLHAKHVFETTFFVLTSFKTTQTPPHARTSYCLVTKWFTWTVNHIQSHSVKTNSLSLHCRSIRNCSDIWCHSC